MKIAIGNDHAAVEYKNAITKYLTELGHTVSNFGTDTDASCDYADFAHPLSESVENKSNDLGILLCGSANGMMMTANKHAGIRAGLAWNKEVAVLIRQHNNANILGIPARFVSIKEAIEIVDIFLATEFEGGRHQKRIEKISC